MKSPLPLAKPPSDDWLYLYSQQSPLTEPFDPDEVMRLRSWDLHGFVQQVRGVQM